jgi:uncharacterized protein YciI
MYAIVLVRYRKLLEEVLKVVEEDRAYLPGLKEKGWLLASGPLDPRTGGMLLRVPEEKAAAHLDQVRDGDPFVKTGTAQYEIWPWLPNTGREDLDRL